MRPSRSANEAQSPEFVPRGGILDAPPERTSATAPATASAEAKRADQRIQNLNRTYALLSTINQAIAREKNPQAVLNASCQIAVEMGLFRMAWIGFLDMDAHRVNVAASAGEAGDYLENLKIILDDKARAQGPVAEALRTGCHAVCNDIENDPRMAPWRENAVRMGFRSCACFPLKAQDKTVGTFNLYAGMTCFFDDDELRLLDQMALDVSFAMEIGRRETERRRAEEELRWRTAFFEALVNSSLDGILVVDTQGRKILQNRRMNELWHIPTEIAEGNDDKARLQFLANRTTDPGLYAEKALHLSSHPEEISRDELDLIDGTVLECSTSPVRDKAGKHYGRIWSFRDITGQRQLEEQFRHAQKMEAIGVLAGGVAHNFNNILAAMMMQAELADMDPKMAPKSHQLLDNLKSCVERAANLTRQLMAFSRREALQPELLDLNEIISGLTMFLGGILGDEVRLQLKLSSDPLPIFADAGMIEGVLVNLILNARDAMPRGGQIFVQTGGMILTQEQAGEILEAKPGRHICLRVTDTGTGIAPENLSRIFQPFFTTKEPGKGAGLGLATVFAAVKQHSGSVRVDSEVGKGTTFQILLPAAQESEAASAVGKA